VYYIGKWGERILIYTDVQDLVECSSGRLTFCSGRDNCVCQWLRVAYGKIILFYGVIDSWLMGQLWLDLRSLKGSFVNIICRWKRNV